MPSLPCQQEVRRGEGRGGKGRTDFDELDDGENVLIVPHVEAASSMAVER